MSFELTDLHRTRVNLIKTALTEMRDTFKRGTVTNEIVCFLYAIARQESDWVHRKQNPTGPARGFWQFEPGLNKGIDDVLTNDWTRKTANEVCKEYVKNSPTLDVDWAELSRNTKRELVGQMFELSEFDNIAVMFARLYFLPIGNTRSPLPALPYIDEDDWEHAWDSYRNRWRWSQYNEPHSQRYKDNEKKWKETSWKEAVNVMKAIN